MTLSVWQRPKSSPEQLRADIAIVGAGITGLSAAIECEARGLSAVVLEADLAGSKASGRNAGFLIRGAAENYAAACETYGRDKAKALWALTEENLRGLKALGLESVEGFHSVPSCVCATQDEELAQLNTSHEMLLEDGFDSELVAPSNAPGDALWRSGRVLGGVVNPNDAVCSPIELVRLLHAALGATPVFENSEVYRIELEEGCAVVMTPGVEVRASRVLLCTNAYAAQICPELRAVITPNRAQMLACRPEDPSDAALAHAYYLNHGSEYIRAGEPGEILIGGARKFHAEEERTAVDDTSPAVQERLERFVRELITDRFLVTARWAGIMGFSPDGLPLITRAELPNTQSDGRVWFAGGLTGHGMSMGYSIGRMAVGDALKGEPGPFGRDRLSGAAG